MSAPHLLKARCLVCEAALAKRTVPPDTTTAAEPADVEVVWVDDDGSTIDHYEGE